MGLPVNVGDLPGTQLSDISVPYQRLSYHVSVHPS